MARTLRANQLHLSTRRNPAGRQVHVDRCPRLASRPKRAATPPLHRSSPDTMALGSPRRFLPLFPVNKGYTSVTLDMCQTMQMVYSQLGVHEAAFVSRPESVPAIGRKGFVACISPESRSRHIARGPIWKRLRSSLFASQWRHPFRPCQALPCPRIPLTRQWIVLQRGLRRYGATVRELAELEVSLKTIREPGRRATGLPGGDRGCPRAGARIDRAVKPSIGFPFDEAVAPPRRPAAGAWPAPFWNAAQSAGRRGRPFGRGSTAYIDRFGETFHRTRFGESDYAGKAAIVEQLSQGIDDCREVFVTYRSLRSTEPTTYPIRPFGLTFHRGSLYLVGWAPDHQQIRHWKLDRMEKAAVTEVRFTRPADFDLEEHFKGSFGVTGRRRRRREGVVLGGGRPLCAESTWHPSQQLTPRKDGSLVAEFQLDRTRETWILAAGTPRCWGRRS